ncbi:HD domain-containing protein [Haloimpatiens sp. FM7315]|uniref:HD domain-containing protein n=1 Tax=Haloimpatiens sp. FM7315 TaxID=3298609 RepID=UPI0035A2E049
MNRINKILNNKDYIKHCNSIKELEINRVFCRHNLEHFIDTSRIMHLINLEKNLGYNKDIVYACGLLHDIGRCKEYKDNTPHELASFLIAKGILSKCDFEKEEIVNILNAIKNHRNPSNKSGSLEDLLYKSDKLSRACFNCSAKDKCNWPVEKRTQTLNY